MATDDNVNTANDLEKARARARKVDTTSDAMFLVDATVRPG